LVSIRAVKKVEIREPIWLTTGLDWVLLKFFYKF